MRRACFPVLCIMFMAGCAERPMSMEPPQRPEPAVELAKLQRMIGNWAGTAEMIIPGAPPSDEPMTFEGENKCEWILGGMFLKSEGWHEMGPDERMSYVEFWKWDPKAGHYRTWYFGDWGDHGSGSAKFSSDGKTLHFRAQGTDAGGNRTKGKGTMTFSDDDTMEWTWAETGHQGKMEFKGTSHRQP